MDISLIVCTRNRADQLELCLRALALVRPAGQCEIVLVDNGSTDETADRLTAFAKTSPLPVICVSEPQTGLARARNAGLAVASGRIIAFTDDDCYPQADWLEEISRLFEDETLGYAAGRVLLHDPLDYPITILLSQQPLTFPPRTYLRTGVLQGANMAFRAQPLRDAGGFDPCFGAGALFPAEDIDAAARVNLAGWKGCYAPQLVVSHHHGRKAEDVAALMGGYDVGRGAYNMKMLFSGGRWRWLARSNLELAQRARHDWRSARLEWRAQWAYLRHRLSKSGQTG